MIKLVIVESPFSGDVERNIEYARQACYQCIELGETPYASHLFFPQFLNDDDHDQRRTGINLGLEIGQAMKLSAARSDDFSFRVAFYVDYGWSKGMEAALEHWTDLGASCEIRRLTEIELNDHCAKIDTPDEERA